MQNYPSPLHWSEGMFLAPQHMQLLQQHLHGRIARTVSTARPFSWGIRTLEFDEDALANFKLKVRRLEAVLEDGTHLRVPEDCEVPIRDLEEAFKDGGSLELYIAIPERLDRGPNVFEAGEEDDGDVRRYRVRIADEVDENSGRDAKPVAFRKYQARVLFGSEDLAGYHHLCLGSIELGGELEQTPRVDSDYVPPLISIGGHSTFLSRLDGVLSLLSSKMNSLGKQVQDRTIQWGGEGGGGDAATLLKLQAVYMCYAAMRPQITNPDCHPFDLYRELCRAVGQLAVFGSDRKLPLLAEYDHSQLHRCFQSTINHLRGLLAGTIVTRFNKAAFERVGDVLECKIHESWLVPNCRIYLAAEADLEGEDLSSKIENAKLCSPSAVAAIRRDRLPGLDKQFQHRTPTELPDRKNLHYWELDLGSEHWRSARDERRIALFGSGMNDAAYSLYAVMGGN